MNTLQESTTNQLHVSNFAKQIGERIRLAREEKGLTQEDFAKELGVNNHQTASAIETGLRQLQPDELTRACQILNKPLFFFTDPYVITETHAFSYRAKANSQDIGKFERKAHNLISANRRFREVLDEPVAPIGPQLRGLHRKSYLQQATIVGERVWRSLKLGDPPALKLRDAIEAVCRINVLFVDAPASISGAACHLPDGDFILINRTEASFRRNFDLGHEFFHILTWTQMPPERLDPELEGNQKPKVEKLADAFTAGLLMPSEVVCERWKDRNLNEDVEECILKSAKELRVSGPAMYWRLVNLSLLSQKEQDLVSTDNLSRHDDEDPAGRPNLFNADFVRRLHAVLQRGVLSTRKASELLDCDPDDLRTVCAAYGLDSPSQAQTPETNAAAQRESVS